MAMAGWTRTDMLVRYTAAERAAQEARRLNLVDIGDWNQPYLIGYSGV